MTSERNASKMLAHWVHWSLLAGLIASGLLLITGLIIATVHHQSRPPGLPEAGFELLSHALHGDGVAILNLGLLILLLTPALRVAVLIAGWIIERDWIFAGVASTVLVLLGVSLILGMG